MSRPNLSSVRPALRTITGLTLTVLALLPLLASCDAVCERLQPARAVGQPMDIGYAVLRKLLDDEEHLKTLRIVKSVITFRKTGDSTIALIDDIATVSARGLDELDRLAALEPAIDLDTPSEERLGNGILDALRVATARDLLAASGEDFEIRLVLSQTQVLRLIAQLLSELREMDTNPERQAWLAGLADEYETLYSRAVARLSVAG